MTEATCPTIITHDGVAPTTCTCGKPIHPGSVWVDSPLVTELAPVSDQTRKAWPDHRAGLQADSPLEPAESLMAGDGYRTYPKQAQRFHEDPLYAATDAEIDRAEARGEHLDVEIHDIGDRWGVRWSRHDR